METLESLRNQVLALVDETGDTGTTKTIVDNTLNQAQQLRLAAKPWPFLRWEPLTFTTTAGTRRYPLHQEYYRPYYFFNRTKKEYLVEMNPRELGPSGVRWNEDQQGPEFYIESISAVQRQPSSASVISIVSSSTADNSAARGIIVYGDTADGVTSETITPNGTSTVPGTVSFTKILAVTKLADWTGTLTMTSNSGGVTNLKLFAAERGRNYPQLVLLSDPATGDVIEYQFYRRPRKMVNDDDVPEIPDPCSQILVWDAILILGAYNNMQDPARLAVWSQKQAEWEEVIQSTFFEGQSLEAQPRFVRDNLGDRSELWPRFYR